jgi:hypothetical protein
MRGIAPLLSRRSVLPLLPLHRVSRLLTPNLVNSFSSYSHLTRAPAMDESVKQHYLADSPPTVVRLEIKTHFDTLKDQNLRKYAHFMSRYGLPELGPLVR